MYEQTKWLDRVTDPQTGAVVQKGTILSAGKLNNMEEGINDAHIASRLLLIVADNLSGYGEMCEALRVDLEALAHEVEILSDVDEGTLAEIEQLVEYLKNNEDILDQITKSKVNVSDIVNNLTSDETNKPLAAAQGKVLKALYDALEKTLNTVKETANGAAPKSHSSAGTEYGIGTGSNYGHVKLSDSDNDASGASSGVAATPAAVKKAKDAANSAATAASNAKTAADNAQNTANSKAPQYQYSTSDLTAGSSSLTTGVLYLVYE